MLNTIDVVRRGGEKETIIVPLTGAKPKPRREPGEAIPTPRVDLDRDIAAEEAALDAQEGVVRPAPPQAPPKKPEGGSIPLD